MRDETKEIKSGDLTYKFSVKTWPVVIGREALVKLQRTLGPALGELVEGRGRTGIARAVGSLAERLTASDLEWFVAKAAEQTTVEHPDGRVQPLAQKGVQDDVFAGSYLLMFAWLEFVLEVNFRDFLDLLKSATRAPAPPAETPKSA